MLLHGSLWNVGQWLVGESVCMYCSLVIYYTLGFSCSDLGAGMMQEHNCPFYNKVTQK